MCIGVGVGSQSDSSSNLVQVVVAPSICQVITIPISGSSYQSNSFVKTNLWWSKDLYSTVRPLWSKLPVVPGCVTRFWKQTFFHHLCFITKSQPVLSLQIKVMCDTRSVECHRNLVDFLYMYEPVFSTLSDIGESPQQYIVLMANSFSLILQTKSVVLLALLPNYPTNLQVSLIIKLFSLDL